MVTQGHKPCDASDAVAWPQLESMNAEESSGCPVRCPGGPGARVPGGGVSEVPTVTVIVFLRLGSQLRKTNVNSPVRRIWRSEGSWCFFAPSQHCRGFVCSQTVAGQQAAGVHIAGQGAVQTLRSRFLLQGGRPGPFWRNLWRWERSSGHGCLQALFPTGP